MGKVAEAVTILEITIKAQQTEIDKQKKKSESSEELMSLDLHVVNICAELCMSVGLWERAATIISNSEKCNSFEFSLIFNFQILRTLFNLI